MSAEKPKIFQMFIEDKVREIAAGIMRSHLNKWHDGFEKGAQDWNKGYEAGYVQAKRDMISATREITK